MLNLDLSDIFGNNNYTSSELNKQHKDYEKGTYISKCAKIRPYKKYDVKIPKIIMQTWKNKQVPRKWKTSPESVKEMMPDWKYVLMTDEENRNFVKKHFPDFLPYYDDFPYGIQRADAIRYMWLYIHGGIYMDLDFEIQNPLDYLFITDNDIYLVNSGNIGSFVTNSFMASKPGVKFWLTVIEEMKKPLPWYTFGKHFQVMNSTGPIMLTRVMKREGLVYGNLPAKYVMPCSICNINCSTCESYLKPLQGSSWVTYDTMFYNFWLCNWKLAILIFVLILLLIGIAFIVKWSGLSKDKLWPPWAPYR